MSVIRTPLLFSLSSAVATYLTPVVSDHLYVDTTRGDRIRVNVNITFPSMPCAGLNLVAMDVAGEQQIDVVNNVIKTRMSLDGGVGVEHAEAEMAERLGHQQRQHTRGACEVDVRALLPADSRLHCRRRRPALLQLVRRGQEDLRVARQLGRARESGPRRSARRRRHSGHLEADGALGGAPDLPTRGGPARPE